MAKPSSSRSNGAKAYPGGLPLPIRVGEHLALDFLNTVAAPRGTVIEWIGNGRDLLNWMSAVGAIDPAQAERFAASATTSALDAVAEEAVALREWFRGVVARLRSGDPHAVTADDVARLNSVLTRDAMFRRVEPAGEDGRLRVVTNRPWREPGELLAPVAAAMADLLSDGDFALVRRCGNPACPLWFYDRTKGHRRRWCSQAVCGNRAKVAAHRERRRMGG